MTLCVFHSEISWVHQHPVHPCFLRQWVVHVLCMMCMYQAIMHYESVCIHTSPDHHPSMLNLTSRLAVKIKNLPAFEFDWADTTPRLWTFLNVDDFLPSEANATVLHQRAVHYMVEFLVGTFSNLKHLAVCSWTRVDSSCNNNTSCPHEDPEQRWKVQNSNYWHSP